MKQNKQIQEEKQRAKYTVAILEGISGAEQGGELAVQWPP